jgi:hypothetical protein
MGAERVFERRARAARCDHQDRQLARVLAIADRAQQRLYARCRRMELHGKASPKIVVAMARELTGYLWVVLHPAAAATRI